MIRGGSWNNNPRNVRCANRNNNHPENRNNNLGFRLASTGGRQHPAPATAGRTVQPLSRPGFLHSA